MRTRRALSAVLAALAPSGAALAAEEGGGNIFAGDLGNAIWTVVVFLIVLFVLGKYAWGPLLGSLQEREKFIHDALSRAKEDREAAEARLKEYEARLGAARAEATAIVEEGRRDGEAVKARIEAQAREEAERMIERARREIGIAKDTAVKDLYVLAGRLATDAASRIIRKELAASDHERLIAEAIAALESEAAGPARSGGAGTH
jgi:F-type H+-transporting ATPase subunit b